jgi:hypothetical protein
VEDRHDEREHGVLAAVISALLRSEKPPSPARYSVARKLKKRSLRADKSLGGFLYKLALFIAALVAALAGGSAFAGGAGLDSSGSLLPPGDSTATAASRFPDTPPASPPPKCPPNHKCEFYEPSGSLDTASATYGETNVWPNQTAATTATKTTEEAGSNSAPSTPENISQRINRLDETGTNAFYQGVEKVAIGITKLAGATDDFKENGNTQEVQAARADAVQTIGEGNHDLATGRAAVADANAIRANQARLANVGANATAQSHMLAYDNARAPDSTKQALETMEKQTGVPASELINAVNQGGIDRVVNLAAEAAGMNAGELAGQIPDFGVSTAGSDSSKPNAPAFNGAGAGTMAGSALPGSSAIPRLAKRMPSSAGETKRTDEKFESLQPLSADQFLGRSEEPVASASEFGDPGDSLFHRVSGQYLKRRTALVKR